MWFTQETSLAYETGIAPVLSDAGLLAVRKDRQKHTHEIVTVSGYNGLSLSHIGNGPYARDGQRFGRHNRPRDQTADSAICQKEDHNDAEDDAEAE
jgi:hypothetical protein